MRIFLIFLLSYTVLNAEEYRYKRKALHISNSLNERYERRSPVVFNMNSNGENSDSVVMESDNLFTRTKRDVDKKKDITTKVSIYIIFSI